MRAIGIAVAGQSADLVPADKKLYALRDVTATVDEVSLIAASIMSKKIAAGASALVLDVKVGEGAFMRTTDEARELARGCVTSVSRRAWTSSACSRTWISRSAARSATRSRCARRGRRSAAAGRRTSASSSSTRPRSCSRSRISAWTRPRGGSARNACSRTAPRWRTTTSGFARREATRIRRAAVGPVVRVVPAPATGFVRELGAREVAVAALELGAGREVAGDPIDHAVGVVCVRKRGEAVAAGEPLAEIHARDDAAAEVAEAALLAAYEIGDAPEPRPLVLDVIR